jgi:hypothetical protein
MCKWIDEESAWCRYQTRVIRLGATVDINKAIEIAEYCEDEGIVSTTGMALRTLAKEYKTVKAELDLRIYEETKHIPQLLKERV